MTVALEAYLEPNETSGSCSRGTYLEPNCTRGIFRN